MSASPAPTELSSTNGSAAALTTSTTSRKTRGAKVFTRRSKIANTQSLPTESDICIFYSTLTGTSEKYALHLRSTLSQHSDLSMRRIHVQNLDYLDDLDSYFVAPAQSLYNALYLFVIPSYASESPLDFFIETLKDTYNDFRIDSRPLRNLGGYAVFGIGDREGWDEDMYCYQAMLVDKYLRKLGAPRAFPVGTGNVKGNANDEFEEWISHLSDNLADPANVSEMVDISDSDDEEVEEVDKDADGADSLNLSNTTSAKDVIDVEDMGVIIENSRISNESTIKKAMVGRDTPTYNALTKQGYTIVGSHSGVKICRWTKSALRGRGSCYKFAFYGIKSHLCMETTPSLSCSNKCVFCWRHGSNPVGTTWRWQVDPPDVILEGALEAHYAKIKQMRGVPGVQAARFAEAFTVRHCALSLVGEPIFYPHINEFVRMLHERGISSFLVCNAQHPEQLKTLEQVTQLYVSIDASDKESLRRIDRPLHRDFWERFNRCLDIIRNKTSQRTVFRLTLVKGFNASEVLGYAKLVAQALPCFIEIKGVTYCGTSAATSGQKGTTNGGSKGSLTMANVPFYEEVRDFVLQLNASLKDLGLDYDIAAEHAHSCCILIAQNRFKIEGEWYTHIDYARFFELLREGGEFGPMDYIAKSPSWALFGAEQAGFNPEDERVVSKKSKAYKIESGRYR
ncbi:hypothetical protein POJ06DRAFT_196328 [Lipomyces tetrasporus]|uniref:S-adenosyl-L-methionine-dependent tRNA 4-demethylwyosine synthase n=1 Tax=Lipomyces tetrasporus TaxID=54092 RepID=A0AAD7QSQ6_9ASCO|nr:uncharacterized protein POJ06DRAFT_196328 [Lipomyces tetrasporus]KAJ8100709.1 hypothetical protein POJ06DRAFT_196328 [Lipomyces tetrasporus]